MNVRSVAARDGLKDKTAPVDIRQSAISESGYYLAEDENGEYKYTRLQAR